jgi:hypothetical protein
MGMLAADATDCCRDLSDPLLKTLRNFHRFSSARVEDGCELSAQSPVLLFP